MHARPVPHRLRRAAVRTGTLAALLALTACAQAPKIAAPGKTPPPTPSAAAPAESRDTPRPVMDPRALDRLKRMSDTLMAAKSFSYRTRTSGEIPAPTGQFLTTFARTDIAVERPDKVSARVGGDLPPYRIVYDGATITAFDPAHNMYATQAEPGGIGAAVRFLEDRAGIPFPAEDFLAPDPYASMTRGLVSAFVAGPSEVDGHPTEHLAFMGEDVNWEIWIDSGQEALPRRFAITFKEAPNFPRFLIEFLDWKLNPRLPAGEFAFKAPVGARRIDFATEVAEEFTAPAEGKAAK